MSPFSACLGAKALGTVPDTYEEIFEISNRNRGRNKEKKRLRDDDDDADDNAGGKWRGRARRACEGGRGERQLQSVERMTLSHFSSSSSPPLFS